MGRPKLKFESQYVPVTESGCWLWIGGLDADGYGCMSHGVRAHRESYRRTHGSIPAGAVVCHRCDVRCCVNPAHLFCGRPIDNNNDKVKKGRHAKGTATGRAKLTDADVVAILLCSDPCFVIAQRYGLTDTSVSFIKLGKTWKHVQRPDGYSYTPYRAPGNHKKWEQRRAT